MGRLVGHVYDLGAVDDADARPGTRLVKLDNSHATFSFWLAGAASPPGPPTSLLCIQHDCAAKPAALPIKEG
jgi:hypothetical protein